MGDKNENKLSFSGIMGVLLLAIIIVVMFILPAEYGVDPTGVGNKLGLIKLTNKEAPSEQNTGVRVISGDYPAIPEEFDSWEPDIIGAPFSTTQLNSFSSDQVIINLDSGEQLEYKALMQQGDVLVYSWSVNKGVVYTDFHADPKQDAQLYPDDYFIRYRESETSSSAGSIVAPFGGNHGWYWLNIEEHPIEITLNVSGFYSELIELGRSFQ